MHIHMYTIDVQVYVCIPFCVLVHDGYSTNQCALACSSVKQACMARGISGTDAEACTFLGYDLAPQPAAWSSSFSNSVPPEGSRDGPLRRLCVAMAELESHARVS